jgi:hypothetical protein
MRRIWTSGQYWRQRRRGLGGVRACKPSPSKPLFVSFRFLTSFVQLCKEDPYPEKGAQRTLGAGDFFCCGSHAGAAAGFFCKKSTYPFGVEDVKRE